MKLHYLEKKSEVVTIKKTLHSCLKQLQFIYYFESHLERGIENKYPVEFLKKLESIKYQTQIKTMKAINYYKNS